MQMFSTLHDFLTSVDVFAGVIRHYKSTFVE